MKRIVNYINEKLRVTSKSFYTCQPNTKDELQEIIIQRIKDEGPKCELNDIDVSQVDDMSYLFNAGGILFKNEIFTNFNGNVSLWDVSNVTSMQCMFRGCEKFNGDISRWNVSKVKDMELMFCECKEFNCDISHWNISNVENIHCMFLFCRKFNQNLDNWDVSNNINMLSAFKGCPTKPKWYK